MTIDRPLFQSRPNHFITDARTLGVTAQNWPVRVTVPGHPPRHCAVERRSMRAGGCWGIAMRRCGGDDLNRAVCGTRGESPTMFYIRFRGRYARAHGRGGEPTQRQIDTLRAGTG